MLYCPKRLNGGSWALLVRNYYDPIATVSLVSPSLSPSAASSAHFQLDAKGGVQGGQPWGIPKSAKQSCPHKLLRRYRIDLLQQGISELINSWTAWLRGVLHERKKVLLIHATEIQIFCWRIILAKACSTPFDSWLQNFQLSAQIPGNHLTNCCLTFELTGRICSTQWALKRSRLCLHAKLAQSIMSSCLPEFSIIGLGSSMHTSAVITGSLKNDWRLANLSNHSSQACVRPEGVDLSQSIDATFGVNCKRP